MEVALNWNHYSIKAHLEACWMKYDFFGTVYKPEAQWWQWERLQVDGGSGVWPCRHTSGVGGSLCGQWFIIQLWRECEYVHPVHYHTFVHLCLIKCAGLFNNYEYCAFVLALHENVFDRVLWAAALVRCQLLVLPGVIMIMAAIDSKWV